MKSLLLGNPGQWRGTEGNLSFGLITQRSKVQILPPQPTHSSVVIPNSPLPEASANLSSSFYLQHLKGSDWSQHVGSSWERPDSIPDSITDTQICVLRLSAESVVTKIVTNSERESSFAAGAPPTGRSRPRANNLTTRYQRALEIRQ